ncbi:Glycosyltransferase, GT2 family [Rhodoblastus acidophilus]|uniref:Glycosyltransferase, GT2 family n=1 Tax=Rhodoblastus acidophilus TaxID=1074 RepID=A0A212QM49_RHOAC|nr:glycosyltransferase [Rhodoblastus acidophilus]SNB60447.1 Glycosyltransferase, GT2 family [Rhodoblastus acidophilus]
MNGEPLLIDRGGHDEALARLAAERLRRGDFASAFRFADRRCRLGAADALDFLLRSESARGAGLEALARADLVRALDLDPTHRAVLRFVLQWGHRDEKLIAARAAIDDPACGLDLLRLALAEVFAEGTPAILRLQTIAGRLTGWAAWRAGEAPDLLERRDPCTTTLLTPAPQHPLRLEGVEAVDLSLDPEGLAGVTLRCRGRHVASWAAAPEAPAAARATQSARLWVIVPVYEDFAATRACLTAAMAQLDEVGGRVVVVDDASPNAALSGWLDINAASGRLELIRNPENLGFAASVNRALSICDGGDVILLNADALPPRGVFARLAALSRAAPDVGALTPLSNNGETCSFPIPNACSPLPGEREVARLDALARQANGDLLIDLPNGIGFCLYITRACLDAVGPLPEVYGRGYYEDVEFCLRAREKGFRTVCAAGVYVGHAGSLSFGAEKRRLVVRNMQALRSRFPGHEAECAAFLRADPLNRARAALERLDAPLRPFRLIVAALGADAADAEAEAAGFAADAPAPLICRYDPQQRLATLRGPAGVSPQSLEFDLSEPRGFDALGKWLVRLRLTGITLFFSHALPAPLLAMLPRLGELELAIAGLEWFARPPRPERTCQHLADAQPCPACAHALSDCPDTAQRLRFWQEAAGAGATLRPLDQMTAYVARRLFPQARVLSPPDVAAFTPQVEGGRVLGLLSPQPEAGADALALSLAHALRRRGDPALLVVFGACLDDFAAMAPGNVLVTGPVEEAQLPDLVAAHGVTELMSGSRTRHFGRLDALAAACRLPRASFDWSSGALPFHSAELALDPRLCDRKTAERVADWLAARRAMDSEARARNESA